MWRSQYRQQAGCLWKVEAQCTGLRVPGQGLSPEYAAVLPAHFSPWGFSHLFGTLPCFPQGIGSGKEALCSRTFSETCPILSAPWAPSTGYGLGDRQKPSPLSCTRPGSGRGAQPPCPQQLLPDTVSSKQVSSCHGRGQVRVTCASRTCGTLDECVSQSHCLKEAPWLPGSGELGCWSPLPP